MKKRAIIYTRVSTDEQNNGYSPADQKDKLYKYCEQNNIEVAGFYHDDESGTSFDRPEWIKIMSFIKKNRGFVDNIYFIKWDRFSRNVAEAYITIRDLKKLGVEAQSIEQPLDFEIPESKIMLAIYLAAPEVDNDRRALNVLNGIRRAKKQGRSVGSRLRGYKNERDANNKPIIVPEGGKQQEIVTKAFREFATGLYNIEELRRKINKEEGLNITRCPFWEMLRNKAYIGKVLVSAYKDEQAHWVDGIHEPLIDDVTFYTVQDILEGRKKNRPNKVQTIRDEFPLRGFLQCPRCNSNLTASASKGKMGTKFYYYHCSHGCKERQRAKDVNEAFENYLADFKTNPQSIKLLGDILKQQFKEQNHTGKTELEKIQQEIAKQRQRIKNGKDLMLDGELTATEYKEMKYEIEEKLDKLNAEESKYREGIENHDDIIDDGLDIIQNLDKYYTTKRTAIKQRIVSSIFPEKLIFENKAYRTPKINSAVSLLCRNSKALGGDKKTKHLENEVLSCGVELARIEKKHADFFEKSTVEISQYIKTFKSPAMVTYNITILRHHPLPTEIKAKIDVLMANPRPLRSINYTKTKKVLNS
jgi:DNA invertase Pin-like site-specific DNA recombinase